MQNHQLIEYFLDAKYHVQDVPDLLLAATIKGQLNIEGKQPVHLNLSNLLNLSQEGKMGFDNIECTDQPITDKIQLHQIQTSSGKTQYITGKLEELKTLFSNRIVIFPTLDLSRNDISFKDLQHQHLKTSKLIIVPIQSGGHTTVFILDHQNNSGYYFDPLGRDSIFFKKSCEDIGYKYSCNEEKLQDDEVSCAPISVEFIFHVIDCINKGETAISTKAMPKFVLGTAPYNEMRESHRNLLSELEINPINIVISARQYLFKSYTRKDVSPNSDNIDNLHCCLAITLLGVLSGGIIGYSITRIPAANQVITTFLANNLHIESAKAEIIFSISSTVICAAICAVIAYSIGNYALKEETRA